MTYNGAPVAQLDRASGYEPEGREFESPRARHTHMGQAAHKGDLKGLENLEHRWEVVEIVGRSQRDDHSCEIGAAQTFV